MVEWRKTAPCHNSCKPWLLCQQAALCEEQQQIPEEHSSVCVGAQSGAQAGSHGNAHHDGMENLSAIPDGKNQLAILHSSMDNSLCLRRLEAKTDVHNIIYCSAGFVALLHLSA